MRALLVIVLAAAACTKAPDRSRAGSDADCPDLSVTVDGTPVHGLTHGLAFSYQLNGTTQWQVDVSSLATGCERYMGKDGRTLREGEHSVTAWVGVSPTVAIDNLGFSAEKLEIVGATPRKPGDKLALCVTRASVTGELDAYKDKRVVINGKLEGTYCGVKKVTY